MPKKHPAKAVREPVQVYLDSSDREALDRAAASTGLPRAEVLRRGLRRYAAEILAAESPVLAFLERAAGIGATGIPADAAERHDEILSDSELASWSRSIDGRPE